MHLARGVEMLKWDQIAHLMLLYVGTPWRRWRRPAACSHYSSVLVLGNLVLKTFTTPQLSYFSAPAALPVRLVPDTVVV